MPINEWINRENVLLAYSGLVFTAIKKKKEIMPFATTLTNLGGIKLSEFSQIQEKQLYDLICGI